IAQLERWNLLLVHVLVQSVRTHSQILRSLTNVHHFSRGGHSRFPARSSVFWCAEHISNGSAGLSPSITRFCWVLWGFSGFDKIRTCMESLQVVFMQATTTTGSGFYSNRAPVTGMAVTKVLETVRRYLNGCASPRKRGDPLPLLGCLGLGKGHGFGPVA